MAFAKMITESTTMFFQWVKKLSQVIKKFDSAAIVRIPLLNSKAIVKKFNLGYIGNSIHRYCKGVALAVPSWVINFCTLMNKFGD